MSRETVAAPARPKVLLVGDPAARPAGLERALTRAGFQLVERENPTLEPDSDAVLITVSEVHESSLADLIPRSSNGPENSPPGVVIIASDNRDAAAAALALGAADALAAPIHLPELCARLHARIRQRKLSVVDESEAANEAIDPDPAGDLEALDRRMRQEFERARRYSLSFSLILLGVDALHGLQDRNGAEAAERLRQRVAIALRKELRVPDFVVAYGDSEFAIVLPETGQTGARQSVIRVRERLAMVPPEGDPRTGRPRFSAGIVTYPHPAVSQSDELYALAEAALMRGRAQSGERIGVAI